ncbi:MAG: recombinase family protein [Methylocystis sp.]
MRGAATAHSRSLLSFLGRIAEFERKLVRARTSEGRARVKARGIHIGRPLRPLVGSARKRCATSPKAT